MPTNKPKTQKTPKTCSYGTFNAYIDDQAPSLYYAILRCPYIAPNPQLFDIDTITTQFTATINKNLPPGVTLTGDNLTGPAPFDYELTYAITAAFTKAETELAEICYHNTKKIAT